MLALPRYLFSLLFLMTVVHSAMPASWGQGAKPLSRASRSVPNILPPSYYTGLDFLADGQTTQAYSAFEDAYNKARQNRDERGIDSIPPLVMMGECLLHQGDIGSALQQYDGALSLSLRCAGWMGLLTGPIANDKSENRIVKDALWNSPGSRAAPFGGYPSAWYASLGGQDTLPELGGGRAGTAQRLQVDALEILRSQSIALRRRYQLLGPLTKYNPLTASLPQAFTLSPEVTVDEPVRIGASVCHILANLGMAPGASIHASLKQNLTVKNGMDHPLTATALLVLADQAIELNDMKSAEEWALEASLTASRGELYDQVEEGIELWSMTAFQNLREAGSVAKALQAQSRWAQNRSRLVVLRTQIELVRQAALRGETETVRKQVPIATSMLLPKQIVLPRYEAVVSYAQARAAFLENNLNDGIQKLEESLVLMRGSSPLSTASIPLYQLNLTLRLVAEKILPTEIGLPLLNGILDSERTGAWRTSVIEQLVFLTADKLPARREAVRQSLATQDLELQLESWERWKAARVLHSSLLQGRLLELRRAVHGDASLVPPGDFSKWELVRATLSSLAKNAKTLNDWCTPYSTNPKWDSRKWSEEESKRWDGMQRLSANQESLLWASAILPMSVPETVLPRWNRQRILPSLTNSDAVVAFYTLEGELHGYLITAKEIRNWVVPEPVALEKGMRSILQTATQVFPLDSNDLLPAIAAVRPQFLPDEIWKSMQGAERWIVSPDWFLWDFPIEMLQEVGAREYSPVLASHRICYSPTIASIPFLLSSGPTNRKKHLVLESTTYWTGEPPNAKSAIDPGAGIFGSTDCLSLPAVPLPSPLLAKLAPEQYISLLPARWSDPNLFPIVPGATGNTGSIAAWNPLPWGTPHRIWLFGHERDSNATGNGTSAALIEPGDEWLRWTIPLMAQGTQHILISRWNVGGNSSASILTSLQENLEGVTFTEAWQRSVARLWAEEFPSNREPITRRTAPAVNAAPPVTAPAIVPPGNTEPIAGTHPAFWAGYLSIGDPRAANP